jgi:heme-degrading monooxygenase HmoA
MMTIVTHVKLNGGDEPAWDAAMRERVEAAREQSGFVSVQLGIPEDALDERVIIGTWETRADWEAWHNTDEFKQTRAQLEQPEADTRREWWHEVVVEEHR